MTTTSNNNNNKNRGSAAALTEHSTWRKRIHGSRVTATALKCTWRKRIHVSTNDMYKQASKQGSKNTLENRAQTGVQWLYTRPQIKDKENRPVATGHQDAGLYWMRPHEKEPPQGTTTKGSSYLTGFSTELANIATADLKR